MFPDDNGLKPEVNNRKIMETSANTWELKDNSFK